MVFLKLLFEVVNLVIEFEDIPYDYRVLLLLYIIDLILMIYLLATVWDEEGEDDDNKKAMVEDWFIDFFN